MVRAAAESPFLTGVGPVPGGPRTPDGFPSDTVVARALSSGFEFRAPLTVVCGENGSGKSTFLEALAVAARLPSLGASDAARDETLSHLAPFSASLRLSWTKKGLGGFFFRAEDYFAFVRKVDAERRYHAAEIARLRKDDSFGSETARAGALKPHVASHVALVGSYGERGLDVMSHGESFLEVFGSRYGRPGLYLLDEPEAALSPARCLSLVALLLPDLRERRTQVILATHSPVLMAAPGADLVLIDDDGMRRVAYDDLPHVTFMRDFLRNPDRFMRHL